MNPRVQRYAMSSPDASPGVFIVVLVQVAFSLVAIRANFLAALGKGDESEQALAS